MPGTSALYTKIHTYAIERGMEFDQAFTTSPTRTGSSTVGVAWTTNGTAIAYDAGVQPTNGNGSWRFTASTTAASGSRFRCLAGNTDATSLNDNDYSVGFWVKFNSLPSGSSAVTFPIVSVLASLDNVGFSVYITGSSHPTNPSAISFVSKSGGFYTYGGSVADLGWHYIAIRRVGSTGNNYNYYMDGALVGTEAQTFTGTTASITFGNSATSSPSNFTYNICNYYHATSSAVNATAISEIWTAGVGSASTNITITETPATASALFVNPSTIVSHNADPATASGEISYLSVSGSVNYLQDSAAATALQTEPTIVITSPNYTEITTSITASAQLVNPYSVIAVQNISNTADVMTASADIASHVTAVGIGISYVADEATASAAIVIPSKFGPDSVTIVETPMQASALIVDPTVFVTPNYFNYIKKNDPKLYYLGNTTNYGSSSPATFSKTGTWDPSDGGIPMSYLSYAGNTNSYTLSTIGVSPKITLGGTGTVADLRAIHKTKNWSYEFWWKPDFDDHGLDTAPYTFFTNDYFTVQTWGGNTGASNVRFRLLLNNNGLGDFDITTVIDESLFPLDNWSHFVFVAEENGSSQRIRIYINGDVVANVNAVFSPNAAQVDSQIDTGLIFYPVNGKIPGGGSSWLDEIAVYGSSLSSAEVLDHYSFVQNISPNRTHYASLLEASAELPEPVFFAVDNNNFPATPVTASTLIVDPAIDAQRFVNITATALTASSQSVNPSFYGTPDYRKNAEVLTAYSEMSNNNFALDDTYFAYVLANRAPYRYVSFDGTNPAMDYGSDADFSVTPTVWGGDLTSPSFGINNISVKTLADDYTTDGVILKESQYNDDWGTSTDHYHSSFWMQRDGADPSNGGVKVLWNLNGYYDNQHALLFHYQDKLHIQFNNQTEYQTFTSAANVNIFDYERHHIVIDFNHSGANNFVKIYVDAVLVLTANIGNMVGQTINGIVSVGPNDEANNRPRLSVGCLITPFGSTALPATPTLMKIFIDEIHWAKTSITAGQVTSLYNAMPAKDNTEWYADFFVSSAFAIPTPIIRAGTTVTATPLTASCQLVDPTLILVFNKNISATPITASGLLVDPGILIDNTIDVSIAAQYMFASGQLVVPIVYLTVSGQPMIATLRMPSSLPPWYDPYRALVIQQSLTYPAGDYFGFRIGDIDE